MESQRSFCPPRAWTDGLEENKAGALGLGKLKVLQQRFEGVPLRWRQALAVSLLGLKNAGGQVARCLLWPGHQWLTRGSRAFFFKDIPCSEEAFTCLTGRLCLRL